MLKKSSNTIQCYLVLATVLTGSIAKTSVAVAGQLDELARYANFDVQQIAKASAKKVETAATTNAAVKRISRKYDLDELRWLEHDLQVVRFAEACAEIDMIPFVELPSSVNKRVFIGINFDGVFGFHGQLL